MPALLVLAPHPDDLELSAALLCHRAIELGWTVVEMIMTDGARGGVDSTVFGTREHIDRRASEARAAIQRLGGVTVEMLALPDGRLAEHRATAVESVRKQVEIHRPAIVALPASCDRHKDHRATHAIGVEATDGSALTLEYCFWGEDQRQNLVLHHRSGHDAKLAAIREHQSQPLDILLPRIGEQGTESFFCAQPEAAVAFLVDHGFDARQK
ncbi:MAG TPA: PIG-L family deacetylase [Thermoanaerobaculia bacterium]|nr:PIG-L family deacetylase [Thermoanaerobaculia bacterium]